MHLNEDKIIISKGVQMVFLHGLGLNDEEQELLKELVKSWRKADSKDYLRITTRLAELICDEVASEEHRIPEHLEEALD